MTVEVEVHHLVSLESFARGESVSGDLEESLRHVLGSEIPSSKHKRCLTAMLGLLTTHIDHTLLIYILGHLPVLHDLLSRYPVLQKEYAKALVKLAFSSTEPGIRLQASLALVRFGKRFTKQMPGVLKQSYQAFSKACHSVSVHTLPTLSLSTTSLVELFTVSPKLSHAYALKLLRALASQVKDALKHPSVSTIQALQSWKWVAPVRFFARYLMNSKDGMHTPFIQMVCAAMSVKVSMNTLPFHFHLLTCISDVSHMVPNALGALLQIASILSQANSKQEQGKPRAYHLSALLGVSDAETGTRSYHDTAVDEAFYLLLRHLSNLSTEPSFPEVSENVIEFLESMHTKNPRVKHHISLLSSKCESVRMEVKNARLDYAPLNYADLSIKKENDLTLLLKEVEEKRSMKARMALVGVVDKQEKGEKTKRSKKQKDAKRKSKQHKHTPIDEAPEDEGDVLEDLALSSDLE